MTQLHRLSKLMAARGICSRREADVWMSWGWVTVNGRAITRLGSKFPYDTDIAITREARLFKQQQLTIVLNKPVGYVSTQAEKGYQPASCLITPDNCVCKQGRLSRRQLQNLSVAGRLDIDSKGLLLFTQDGALVRRVIGENSEIEKEYLVSVVGIVGQGQLKKLRFGLSLDDKPLKRAVVEIIRPGLLRFVLREGKKRQIRRMCSLVGLTVTALKRVRIGNLRLGSLASGQWKFVARQTI